jgi:histone acetyltransferase (RNA polymerase elongator complex component)
VLLDRKEIKRQKDKERYASMSREQKDELNRKARERRVEKKRHDQEIKCEEGTRMDENAPNGSQDQGTVSVLELMLPILCGVDA